MFTLLYKLYGLLCAGSGAAGGAGPQLRHQVCQVPLRGGDGGDGGADHHTPRPHTEELQSVRQHQDQRPLRLHHGATADEPGVQC